MIGATADGQLGKEESFKNHKLDIADFCFVSYVKFQHL